MGAVEIVIIVVCCVAVAAVVGAVIYKKVKGIPTDCGCGCANCPHSCSGKDKTEHKD
ncbi:MAG: hypothetical protein ACI4MH_06440 [Candidatus Coproplasma sp.]